jgi:hypothetical protein
MGAVGNPPALAFDVFTWRDDGGRPHHSDQVAMAPDLDPEHTETRLFAVEGDTFTAPPRYSIRVSEDSLSAR